MLSVKDIILLLRFCLHNTYFSFQGQFYDQMEGAAMGSQVSPIVANLYMEYFAKSFKYANHPRRWWLRYVDDTFVIQKEDHKQNILEHINSVDPAIKFTLEDNKEDGAIPFLDTIVKPEANGGLSITVYRNPTHMDQYIQWASHHHLSAKYSVINTLTHRAKTVCNKPELFQKEMDYLRKALIHCKSPKSVIDRVENKLLKLTSEGSNNPNTQDTTGTKSTANEVKTKGHIFIPYTRVYAEASKWSCSQYGIQTHFKGNNTLRTSWFSPRIRTHGKQKWGHLLVLMWGSCMWWGIHKRDL